LPLNVQRHRVLRTMVTNERFKLLAPFLKVIRLFADSAQGDHRFRCEDDHMFRDKAARGGSDVTRDAALLLRRRGRRQFGVTFSHRFSLQNDPVGVVNESVQDGVGEGRIADDVVPMIDG